MKKRLAILFLSACALLMTRCTDQKDADPGPSNVLKTKHDTAKNEP